MVMMIIKREFIEYLDIKCLIKYFIYTFTFTLTRNQRYYYYYYYYHSRFIEAGAKAQFTYPARIEMFTPMSLDSYPCTETMIMLVQPLHLLQISLSHANWECYAGFLTVVHLSPPMACLGIFCILSLPCVESSKSENYSWPFSLLCVPLLYFSSRMMVWVSALWFSFYNIIEFSSFYNQTPLYSMS